MDTAGRAMVLGLIAFSMSSCWVNNVWNCFHILWISACGFWDLEHCRAEHSGYSVGPANIDHDPLVLAWYQRQRGQSVLLGEAEPKSCCNMCVVVAEDSQQVQPRVSLWKMSSIVQIQWAPDRYLPGTLEWIELPLNISAKLWKSPSQSYRRWC